MLWTRVIVASLVQLLYAKKFGVSINKNALSEQDAEISNENFSQHTYHYAPNEIIFAKCERRDEGTLQFGYVSTFNYSEEGKVLEFRMILTTYSNMSYLECRLLDIQVVKTVRVYLVLSTRAEAKSIRVNGLFVRLRYRNEFVYPYNGELPNVSCNGMPATLKPPVKNIQYATCVLNSTNISVKLLNKKPMNDIIVAGLKDYRVIFKNHNSTKMRIYYAYTENEYISFHCSYKTVPKFWQIDDIFKMNETRVADKSNTFERRLNKDYNLANIMCGYAGSQTKVTFFYVQTEKLEILEENSIMTVIWSVLAVILLLATVVITVVYILRRKQKKNMIRHEYDYAVPMTKDIKETEVINEITDTDDKYAKLEFNTNEAGMRNNIPKNSSIEYAKVFPNEHHFNSQTKQRDGGNLYANEFNMKYSNYDGKVILEPAYCEIGSPSSLA